MPAPISLDDAIVVSFEYIQNKAHNRQLGLDYGYDVYAPSVAGKWSERQAGNDHQQRERLRIESGPTFNEAVWELCRRGILRPGVREVNGQGIVSGNGYCITRFGFDCIAEGKMPLVMVQSGALAATLAEFAKAFGDGFHQRSQEAILCRETGAWLACCAMAGAAAESILLSIGMKKLKSEDNVLKIYEGRDGRRSLATEISKGIAPAHLQESLRNFLGLLSYWRDDAAHGKASDITQANADEAMRQLLHFCQWTSKYWKNLTT